MPSFRTGILLSAAALLVAACGQQQAGGPGGFPPAEVAVITVQARTVPVTYEYTGQAAGSREVEVRARVTGILQARNFREGAAVKKGESLFTIDPAPFQVAAARAEADLAAAEARLAQAKRNAARLKPLAAEKAVSQKEYDDALSAEAIGEADAKAARARLMEARLNLEYTRVEAPIAGITGRAPQSEGSLVSGPEVLLTTVTQSDPAWVWFGIPEGEQARIRREAEAGRLLLPEGGRFEATVRTAEGTVLAKAGRLSFSDIRVNPQTGTSEARAELPNPDGRLRPGQYVRVVLAGATRPNAILVPQRAVLEGPQGKFVYLLADGKAAAQPVEVGEWSGPDWIITSGLKVGDTVIVDGVMRIGPGAPVKVAEPKPVPKPDAKPEAKAEKKT